ncbi:MAG: MFS transporter [Desulfatiglandales bacterium]
MNKRVVAIIIAGFFTVFTGFAVRYSYGMLLPEMLRELAISMTQAGMIFSSFFITYTVFSPLLGFLGDRYDVRPFLTLFLVILGLGAFLMSFSSSVLNASLFFTLAGIGHSGSWTPVVALINRWVSEKRIGTALAFTEMGSGLGIAVWSVIIPPLMGVYNWRAVWVSLGILAFLVAGMNFLLVRNHPDGKSIPQGQMTGDPAIEPIRVTYSRILHDVKFWLIGVSYLLIAFSTLIPFTFLSAFANLELMLPYEAAARLITVLAIAGMVGKLTLGPLSDHVGRIRVLMLCEALMAVGSLGMAYFQGFFTLSLCAAVFGLGYGAVWTLYAATASDFFPRKSAGSVIGLWTIYLGVGSITSPIIGGWTIDTTGAYSWAFILAMTSATMSLLLLIPLAKSSSGGSSGNL